MSVGEGMGTLSGDPGRNRGRKWRKALSYRGFQEAEGGWNEEYLFTYLWLYWVFFAVHGFFSSCEEWGLL